MVSCQIDGIYANFSTDILPIQQTPPSCIDLDIAWPLLRFSNLGELHLVMANLRFLDEHLTATGAAWRCLQATNLDHNGTGWIIAPNVDLPGIFEQRST